jgi:hypothetical protein
MVTLAAGDLEADVPDSHMRGGALPVSTGEIGYLEHGVPSVINEVLLTYCQYRDAS